MSTTKSGRLEPGQYRDAFLVFIVTKVSTETLNQFLKQAYDQPDVQGALCVMTSKDIASITHESRPPIDAPTSPFLGWPLEVVNDYVEEHVRTREPLSEKFYVVLDEETARNAKSCVLVENVVQRRRRYAEKRLSPTPGYEGDEKVKYVRMPFEDVLQTASALDFGSGDMQELVDNEEVDT
ncbi:hypothetical protein MMC27_002566 [Xylographa pallens]|nr:hypothetical protein [Xylographa pallens]